MISDTISILNPIVKLCDLGSIVFSLVFFTNNMQIINEAVLSALMNK